MLVGVMGGRREERGKGRKLLGPGRVVLLVGVGGGVRAAVFVLGFVGTL